SPARAARESLWNPVTRMPSLACLPNAMRLWEFWDCKKAKRDYGINGNNGTNGSCRMMFPNSFSVCTVISVYSVISFPLLVAYWHFVRILFLLSQFRGSLLGFGFTELQNGFA